jgi:hypothetical protein
LPVSDASDDAVDSVRPRLPEMKDVCGSDEDDAEQVVVQDLTRGHAVLLPDESV